MDQFNGTTGTCTRTGTPLTEQQQQKQQLRVVSVDSEPQHVQLQVEGTVTATATTATTATNEIWYNCNSSLSSLNRNSSNQEPPQSAIPPPFDPDMELSRDASSYIDIISSDDNNNNDDDDDDDTTFRQRLLQQMNSSNIPSSSSNTSTNRHRHRHRHRHLHRSSYQLQYSLYGTIFNCINCIVGAGAIGLGSAMANCGGIISCFCIIAVAVLVKYSLDLIIQLSIHLSSLQQQQQQQRNNNRIASSTSVSYEDLGYAAYGSTGRFFVMVSKFMYAFGCIVAYTIIVHDNFGPAIRHLLHIHMNSKYHYHGSVYVVRVLLQSFYWMITHDVWCTWIISASVILPLSLLRDMSRLASTSFISIIAMITIVGIIIYLWHMHIGSHTEDEYDTTDTLYNLFKQSTKIDAITYNHWFKIRWLGVLNNMGTFVFSFVCHHTVHLTYRSLHPELQTLKKWKYVSSMSLFISCSISLCVALFCYMTFWDRTVSDIFQIYPDSYLIDTAKLLLCITMLFTFPLPFFTCRELLISLLFHKKQATTNNNNELSTIVTNERRSTSNDLRRQFDGDLFEDLNEPLLDSTDNIEDGTNNVDINNTNNLNRTPTIPIADDLLTAQSNAVTLSSDSSTFAARLSDWWNSALLPNEDRQLKPLYHVLITVKLWAIVTVLALSAPNLGDVLDFVGCCSGTLIAFVLPGLFAIRLHGWTPIAAFILIVGGLIGTIGTTCSLRKLYIDTFGS